MSGHGGVDQRDDSQGNSSDGKWYSNVDAIGLGGSGRRHVRRPHTGNGKAINGHRLLADRQNGTFHDYTLTPLIGLTANITQ